MGFFYSVSPYLPPFHNHTLLFSHLLYSFHPGSAAVPTVPAQNSWKCFRYKNYLPPRYTRQQAGLHRKMLAEVGEKTKRFFRQVPLGSPLRKAVTNEMTSHQLPCTVRGLAGLCSYMTSRVQPTTATAKKLDFLQHADPPRSFSCVQPE